jgi:hypothetical protein
MKLQKKKGFKAWLSRFILLVMLPFIWIRNQVVKYLIRLRSKLHIRSLRTAINGADKDKDLTGRKNMVVFNTASGEYEPLQKRLLKNAARAGKNKSNKAMTPGRKKMMKVRKKRILDPHRINQIENKSLYVTK